MEDDSGKIERLDLSSMDMTSNRIEALRTVFPEAIHDGKVDFDCLRNALGEWIEPEKERFGLTWAGKAQCMKVIQLPSVGTLLPTRDESADFENTGNLIIEGDNLEVLKLLQKSYYGKVKMIYIDPPYNTGNEFIYPDDYKEGLSTYLKYTGQYDERGLKLEANTESSGRYHSKWLSMMYPRLYLARNLLCDSGVIFVSIDETEHPRLRMTMDEIFGEENFVADMVWAAGRKNDSRFISISHEYILCYVRDKSYLTEQKIEWRIRKKGLKEIYAQCDRLKKKYGTDFAKITEVLKDWFRDLPDNHPAKSHKHYNNVDERGVYFPDNISWPGGGGPQYEVLHPVTRKPCTVPSGGWRFTEDEMLRQIADNRVHFGEDETTVPCRKSYLSEHETTVPYSVFYQDGRAATNRLRNLLDSDCFPFPKDETLIQELVAMTCDKDALVVDFFAGSGTAAHAVMKQNLEDGGNRKFILVQLPVRDRI